jgi:nicotinamidase-related amidase
MTTAITPQGPIETVDRSSMITKLNEGVVLRPRETAIVTIDMHRGHLDMEVATMAAKPDDAKRVIANAKEMLDLARAKGVPIVHVKLVFRKIPWTRKRRDDPAILAYAARNGDRRRPTYPRATQHGRWP